MNERIKELAEQAGFEIHEGKFDVDVYVDGISIYNRLKLFAELVRADEREACAKLLIEMTDLSALRDDPMTQNHVATLLVYLADSIRARGEK